MSAFLQSLLSCCRSQAAEDDPERQQLLNPDIIPQAPVDEGRDAERTTQEQEADRKALAEIINSTSDRLVSVSTPGPFVRPSSSLSHTAAASPSASRDSSPARIDSRRASTSTWRPVDQPVKVISLSTALDPHQTPSPSTSFLRSKKEGSSNGANGAKGKRPPSSHSLKTLTKSGAATARNGVRPSPLGRRPTSDGEEEEESDEDGRFGTVASYETAREGGTTRGGTGARNGHRGALSDIQWDDLTQEEQDKVVKREEELAEAIKKLERDAESFTIKPVGPLIESWPEST